MKASELFELAICCIAIFASIIFLAIGVEYFPILACWIPLIISVAFTFNDPVFRKYFQLDEE